MMVNLYQVTPNYEYTYFVFATTRNKAKAACVNRNSNEGESYIDMRCKTLVKNIPDFPVEDWGCLVVVESPDDFAYEIVKEMGFEYDSMYVPN